MNGYLSKLGNVEEVARSAGRILLDHYGKISSIDYKSPSDVVTEADRASEKFVTDRLLSEFPDSMVLGEEFGISGEKSDFLWVIDPLDGTANYMMQFPIFAVSIALLEKGTPVLAVVFDPSSGRMLSAAKGCGATLDGAPIEVNKNPKISPTGLFGISSKMMKVAHPFLGQFTKGRNTGSATLHICSVALGHFDGAIDFGTKLWDVAAAALILSEAGGKVTDPFGNPIFPLTDELENYIDKTVGFLTTNGKIHEEAIQLLKQIDGDF